MILLLYSILSVVDLGAVCKFDKTLRKWCSLWSCPWITCEMLSIWTLPLIPIIISSHHLYSQEIKWKELWKNKQPRSTQIQREMQRKIAADSPLFHNLYTHLGLCNMIWKSSCALSITLSSIIKILHSEFISVLLPIDETAVYSLFCLPIKHT